VIGRFFDPSQSHDRESRDRREEGADEGACLFSAGERRFTERQLAVPAEHPARGRVGRQRPVAVARPPRGAPLHLGHQPEAQPPGQLWWGNVA